MSESKPVWIWLPGCSEPVQCGTFAWRPGLGQFRYSDAYKSRSDAVAIDPQRLPITRSSTGASETLQHGLYGVIRDASVDGFGLEQLESELGRTVDNPLQRLELGLGDAVGAIAICDDVNGKGQPNTMWLDDLTDVLRSAPGAQIYGWVDLATGLGGERPKVTVLHRGQMWIAKLQARGDVPNTPLREYLAMTAAKQLGINAADVELHTAGEHQVLLVRRFDRHVTNSGSIHRCLFASAWTVLGLDSDATRGHPGRSYPKFAERLQKWVRESDEQAIESRRELWRRMVFNAAIGNGDDHPRNHGLVYRDASWRLAPAYDIAPPATFSGTLSMAITRDGQSAATRATLLRDCDWFGFACAEANEYIDLAEEVAQRVSQQLALYQTVESETAVRKAVE